jgi:hypothetical protein
MNTIRPSVQVLSRGTYIHTHRQTTFQKPLIHTPGRWKRANPSKSRDRFCHHHNTFSSLLLIYKRIKTIKMSIQEAASHLNTGITANLRKVVHSIEFALDNGQCSKWYSYNFALIFILFRFFPSILSFSLFYSLTLLLSSSKSNTLFNKPCSQFYDQYFSVVLMLEMALLPGKWQPENMYLSAVYAHC